MRRTRLPAVLAAVLVVVGSTVFADRVLNPALLFLSGTVKIGVNGGLPGWSYPRDEPRGFDVELARFLADRYGFTLELVALRPEQRERELRAGHVDLVIANYSIDGSSWGDRDKSRLDVIDFAGPYFLDNSGVMYSRDKLAGYGMEIPVDKVCVSNGTTAQDYLKGGGVFADQDECFRRFTDAEDHAIVGVVTDQSLLTTYAREFGAEAAPAVWQNEPSQYPIHDERYGIAMPDDSPALCRELTDAVDAFLADRDGGWDRAFAEHLDGVADPGRHKPEHADSRLC
ncbi:transporter substrate-binding domain-containing protein [Actinophytocola sp. KF-1]